MRSRFISKCRTNHFLVSTIHFSQAVNRIYIMTKYTHSWLKTLCEILKIIILALLAINRPTPFSTSVLYATLPLALLKHNYTRPWLKCHCTPALGHSIQNAWVLTGWRRGGGDRKKGCREGGGCREGEIAAEMHGLETKPGNAPVIRYLSGFFAFILLSLRW